MRANKYFSRIIQNQEFYLAVLIIAFCVLAGTVNHSFFALENVFNLMKSTVVTGILALGFFLVLLSGEIDISFPAVAAFSMYSTVKILIMMDFNGPMIVPFLIAMAIGALLGLINALFISVFRLQTLIVTLGTLSAFRGFLLVFIGRTWINRLPPSMMKFSKTYLFSHQSSGGMLIGLHSSFFIFLGLAVILWIFLKYTWLGRGVYALGGNAVAAERAGINISVLQFFIYITVGVLAGLAGIVHSSLIRVANPFDIVGTELTVIAAVVLGGASLSGGKGTVFGTVLGVILIVLMNNSLILLGVPSFWQQAVTGIIIILSTTVTELRNRKNLKA